MTMIKGNPAVAPTYLACVWLRSAKHFLSINLPNRIDERPGILKGPKRDSFFISRFILAI